MNRIMTVDFHGVEMCAFQMGSAVFVALKPIVEGMGLDWSSQLKRVKRDPVLSEGMVIMAIPFGRGGKQDHICLRLDLVHGWLFRIDAMRVRAALRERVILYQQECFGVLYRNFSGESDRLLNQELESESSRIRLVTECRKTWGPLAAQQLWRERRLPIVPAMSAAVVPPRQLELNFG